VSPHTHDPHLRWKKS